MIRVIKTEGFGNIQLEDVPVPEIDSQQGLIRTHVTLISRGSELFRRYILTTILIKQRENRFLLFT